METSAKFVCTAIWIAFLATTVQNAAVSGYRDDLQNSPDVNGGENPRNLDRLGDGHILRQTIRQVRQQPMLRDPERPTRGGNVRLDSLGGIAFGQSKRFDALSGGSFGGQKRNFDEIDKTGFNGFVKKNFDEIDRTGFDSFVKKNFDEIDHVGFRGFSKRLPTYYLARFDENSRR